MDEKTREALEIVNDLSSYGCLDSSDERDRKEALAHLQAMAEENARYRRYDKLIEAIAVMLREKGIAVTDEGEKK